MLIFLIRQHSTSVVKSAAIIVVLGEQRNVTGMLTAWKRFLNTKCWELSETYRVIGCLFFFKEPLITEKQCCVLPQTFCILELQSDIWRTSSSKLVLLVTTLQFAVVLEKHCKKWICRCRPVVFHIIFVTYDASIQEYGALPLCNTRATALERLDL